MEHLNKNLGLILTQAERDSSTDLWAEIVIDQIPADQWEQFCDLIFMSDVIDRMAQINPGVGQYRPWFERLVEKMRWHLSDQDDGDGLTGEDSGGIDANVNHSQQDKDAVTDAQGAIDGAATGEGRHDSDA